MKRNAQTKKIIFLSKYEHFSGQTELINKGKLLKKVETL